MKKFFMMMPILVISAAHAQRQAFAVCSTGILESKYRVDYNPNDRNQRSVNIASDTISIEEAQSIFALNVLVTNADKILIKLPVRNFDLFLRSGQDSATYKGTSDMLTDEMKNALKKIRSGTQIYFVYINAIAPDGTYPGIKAVGYYAR